MLGKRISSIAQGSLLAVLTACNGFTGVDTLEVDEDLSEDGSGIGEGNSPQTPGPQTISCAYPLAQTWGADQGQTLASHVRWDEALPAYQEEARPFNLSELYDCDGSKGIHGILVLTSKFFCGPCQQEASQLESEKLHWDAQGLGIEVVELLLNNPESDNSTPTITGAMAWRDQFGLYSVTVAADKNFSMVVGNSVGTPQMTIIDPRTMQVVMRQEGWAGPSQYQTLTDLATQNKAAAGL